MVTEVSDQQSMAASLQQSPYFGMFRDQIEGWVKRLATLQEALASMATVQRKWVYLEPIFARGALPNHASRFRQVPTSSTKLSASLTRQNFVSDQAMYGSANG